MQAAAALSPPVTPVLEVRTPRYPAVALYIVYREYVNRHPGLSELSPDDPEYMRYVERRMRELYPERGYAGMMRDAVAESKRNQAVWAQYERDLRTYRLLSGSAPDGGVLMSTGTCTTTTVDPYDGADPSWTGEEEFAVPPDEQIPTIEAEIDSLQLEGTEIDEIYYFESLSRGTYMPSDGGGGGGGGGGETGPTAPVEIEGFDGMTNDELIRAAAAGITPYSGGGTIQVVPILIEGALAIMGLAGWKYYRVKQAASRAIRISGEFYPQLNEADTRRDAHRHILVNVMLRRFVGSFTAKQIMDNHESGQSGGATVMDLHNNDIGRSYRYHSFRGHWFWDRWDWKEWARKVRSYIDNESQNAEYIPEWKNVPLPTTEQAWAREACVADERYIYFSVSPP